MSAVKKLLKEFDILVEKLDKYANDTDKIIEESKKSDSFNFVSDNPIQKENGGNIVITSGSNDSDETIEKLYKKFYKNKSKKLYKNKSKKPFNRIDNSDKKHMEEESDVFENIIKDKDRKNDILTKAIEVLNDFEKEISDSSIKENIFKNELLKKVNSNLNILKEQNLKEKSVLKHSFEDSSDVRSKIIFTNQKNKEAANNSITKDDLLTSSKPISQKEPESVNKYLSKRDQLASEIKKSKLDFNIFKSEPLTDEKKDIISKLNNLKDEFKELTGKEFKGDDIAKESLGFFKRAGLDINSVKNSNKIIEMDREDRFLNERDSLDNPFVKEGMEILKGQNLLEDENLRVNKIKTKGLDSDLFKKRVEERVSKEGKHNRKKIESQVREQLMLLNYVRDAHTDKTFIERLKIACDLSDQIVNKRGGVEFKPHRPLDNEPEMLFMYFMNNIDNSIRPKDVDIEQNTEQDISSLIFNEVNKAAKADPLRDLDLKDLKDLEEKFTTKEKKKPTITNLKVEELVSEEKITSEKEESKTVSEIKKIPNDTITFEKALPVDNTLNYYESRVIDNIKSILLNNRKLAKSKKLLEESYREEGLDCNLDFLKI